MGQNLDLTTAHVDPSKTLVISIDNNTDFADAVKKLHNIGSRLVGAKYFK